MRRKNDKYKSPAYWTKHIQLMLHDDILHYLDDNDMSKSEFADKLGVSKGYVSQLLNGEFDHKLSKLVELALACDLVPKFELVPAQYAASVARNYIMPTDWKTIGEYRANMQVSLHTHVGGLAKDMCQITVRDSVDIESYDSYLQTDKLFKVA